MRNGSPLAGKGDAWQTDSGGFRQVHPLTECRSNVKSQTCQKEDEYSQNKKKDGTEVHISPSTRLSYITQN